jgi:uncharacterized SAM-binding protein YcdF (DUF218 family)
VSRRVVAVLGYSRRRDAALHAICSARLAHAQRLARAGDTVILSGFPEAELMQSAWTRPDVELIAETGSRSTAQNAANVAAEARALGATELVVVTSSWHRARVSALMRAALRGSGIHVEVEGAAAPRPLGLLGREAVCLVFLPVQLARVKPRAESQPRIAG